MDGQSYDFKYEDIIESDPIPGNAKMTFSFKFAFGPHPTYFMFPQYYMKHKNNIDYGVKPVSYTHLVAESPERLMLRSADLR